MPVYDVRLDLFTVEEQLFNAELRNLSIELNKMFKDKTVEAYENELRANKSKRYFLLKRNVSYVQLQEMKTFPIFNKGKN